MRKNILFLLLTFGLSLLCFADDKTGSLKDSLSYFEGKELANALFTVASSYFPNNSDSTLFYTEKALLEYQKLNNRKGVASCYGLMGAVYSHYGMFDTAIVLIYKTVEWAEENNDIRAFIAYLELGNTYRTMGELTKAKEFYTRALNGSYLPAKRAAFANLGLLHLRNEAYDSASYYFSGGLQEYYKSDTNLPINKFNIASIKMNLASVSNKRGEYENSIKLLNESLEVFKDIGNWSSIAKVFIKLSEAYESIGENEDASLQYLLMSMRIADSLQLSPVMEETYYQLFKYYKKRGEYEKSLEYHIKFDDIRDSLVIESYQSTIAETEIQYKLSKKNSKISSLEKEKQIIFSNAIAVVLGLLLISSVIIFFVNNRRLKHRNAKLLVDAKVHELALKSKQTEQKLILLKNNLREKITFIEELREEINRNGNQGEKKDTLSQVDLLKSSRILTIDDWQEYMRVFNEIYPIFGRNIKIYDDLSTGDKRQLIFLKLGINQKETAYLMGISPEGVKRARQRLSKKIGLESSKDLKAYVESV